MSDESFSGSAWFDLQISRRKALKLAGAIVLGGMAAAACDTPVLTSTTAPTPAPVMRPTLARGANGALVDEFGDQVTSLEKIRAWGNYYEFVRSNDGIQAAARKLITSPWHVQVGGLVRTPKTFDLDDLRKLGQEERIYRQRCMQAWSKVVPWMGFPLHKLLALVEPTSEARWVRFESLYDPQQLPGQDKNGSGYAEWLTSGGERDMGPGRSLDTPYVWPYVETLRLDEAMHDLTLLATGLYGQPLFPENGAPVRLVVPWKYSFKSIKAIVKIDLVAEPPVTFWNRVDPESMGFWANVNPDVPTPRWKQGREIRLLGQKLEPVMSTLLFNGYAAEVASMYTGMDLGRDF
jgi:methionine sulfoxide reductase catalytic subunit